MNKPLLVFGVLGIAALGGLFWLLKPESPRDLNITAASGAPLTPAAEALPDPVATPAAQPVISIEIQQGRRTSGPEIIQLAQGQELRLRLLSDQDAELHLHGYDRRIQLRAGTPLEWTFVGEHSGRFEFELHGRGHGAHEALCVIEVMPR